jgi:transposase-like protein
MPLSFIREYLTKRKKRAREDRVWKLQGFCVFCPSCKALLNEEQIPVNPGYGFYRYTCPACQKETTFDVASYPVPVVATDPMELYEKILNENPSGMVQ